MQQHQHRCGITVDGIYQKCQRIGMRRNILNLFLGEAKFIYRMSQNKCPFFSLTDPTHSRWYRFIMEGLKTITELKEEGKAELTFLRRNFYIPQRRYICWWNNLEITSAKNRNKLNQGSLDHVKVGPTPILELHNLWRQIHMFLDILEFRIGNKKKYLEKLFW